jgi:hypothetical protein
MANSIAFLRIRFSLAGSGARSTGARKAVPHRKRTYEATREAGPSSVMETVAQLKEDFARVEEMGSTEGKAVVKQDAAVCDVECVYGKR